VTSFDKLGALYNQDAAAQAQVQQGPGASALVPRLVSPDAYDLAGCSHNRAVLYWGDVVINSSCAIQAYQCDSYDLFLENEGGCGQCANGTTCSRMGLYVNSALAVKNRIKRFYTVTRALNPYCSNFKVQFTLQAAGSDKDNDPAVGSIYLVITGSLGKTNKALVSKPEDIDLIPGRSYSFYPEISKDLGTLQSVTLYWKPKSNSLLGGLFAKSDYIFLDGDILATDQEGTVNAFTPSKAKVESSKDMVAKFSRQYDE